MKSLAALRLVPIIRIPSLEASLVPVVRIPRISAIGFKRNLTRNEALGMLVNNLLARAKLVKIPWTYQGLTEKRESSGVVDGASGSGLHQDGTGGGAVDVGQAGDGAIPDDVSIKLEIEGIDVKPNSAEPMEVTGGASIADLNVVKCENDANEEAGVQYQSVSVKGITANPDKEKKKKKNKKNNKNKT